MPSNMALATKVRAGFAPAIIRERSDRWRHAMDDPAFRNCVKSGINVDAALVALTQTRGRLRLPTNGEIMRLGSQVSIQKDGLTLEGDGIDFNGTVFRLNAANAGIKFTTSSFSGLDTVRIQGAVSVLQTSGAALTIENNYNYYHHRLMIDQPYNGIDITGSFGVIDLLQIVSPYGIFGYKLSGADAAHGDYGAWLYTPMCDAPYPLVVDAQNNYVGAIARSTAYTTGKFGTHGSAIYMCVVSGTTAATGGPNGAVGTAGGAASNRYIVDGTVTWQFVFNISLRWIWNDSFGFTFQCHDASLLNGAIGLGVTDSLGTSGSFPAWPYLTRCATDHAFVAGVDIQAGMDFNAHQSWFGSTMAGNAVQFGGTYKGEGGLFGCNITGNAQFGVLINAGRGISVVDCDINDNGWSSVGTIPNLGVGAGVKGFIVSRNKFLPTQGNATQAANYPIYVTTGASDGYIITHNLAKGHAISNSPLDGGTGTNKLVEKNVGY